MAKEKDLEFGKSRYSTSYAKAIANRYKGFNLPSPKYYSGWFGFKFLQMLSKPFEEWEAYKEGLIDENGKEQRKAIGSEKDIYNYYVKLVIKLKQLIDKQIDKGRRDLIYQRLFLIRESKDVDSEEVLMEIFKIIESAVSGDMAIGGNGLAKKPMSFKNWLTERKSEDVKEVKIPDLMYHGTVKEIWKNIDNYLYVTSNISHAKYHAIDKADSIKAEGKKATPIIVKVSKEFIEKQELLPDDDVGNYNYKTWKESFLDVGTFIIKGKINSSKFKFINI